MPQLRVAFNDLLRNIRLNGLHVGREEKSSPCCAHLVYVVDYLRMPDVVNLVNDNLRLLLRERVPVAVVVVADVLVVEHGRVRALKGCAESLVVPVLYDIDAVGVQGRH